MKVFKVQLMRYYDYIQRICNGSTMKIVTEWKPPERKPREGSKIGQVKNDLQKINIGDGGKNYKISRKYEFILCIHIHTGCPILMFPLKYRAK